MKRSSEDKRLELLEFAYSTKLRLDSGMKIEKMISQCKL